MRPSHDVLREIIVKGGNGAMGLYGNLGGSSSVVAYRGGAGWIEVQFRDGGNHLFSDAITETGNVRQMKELAQAGRRLNRFI